MPRSIPHYPAPRYSAAELTSCQLLNDLTAATLRLSLLRRSGLAPHQLAHVRELARCLDVAATTVRSAHVDAIEADTPDVHSSARRRLPLLDVRVMPDQDHDNHPVD